MIPFETAKSLDILGLPPMEGENLGPFSFDTETYPQLAALETMLEVVPHLALMQLPAHAQEFADKGEFNTALYVLDKGLSWKPASVIGKHYANVAKAAARAGETDLALAIVMSNERILAGQRYHSADQIPFKKNSNYLPDFSTLIKDWLAPASSVYLAVVLNKPENEGAKTTTERAFRERVDATLLGLFLYKALPDKDQDLSKKEPREPVKLVEICENFAKAGERDWAQRVRMLDPGVERQVSPSLELYSSDMKHSTQKRLGNVAIGLAEGALAWAMAKSTGNTLDNTSEIKHNRMVIAAVKTIIAYKLARASERRFRVAARGKDKSMFEA